MERESGYYWVKLSTDWIVAEYDDKYKCWYFTGTIIEGTDSDLDEIDERKIERNGNNS